MKESQPRQQHQPSPPPQQQAQQQSRTRTWITADGQTSRRPRAVAGQRAAAKRASAGTAQPVQSAQTQPGTVTKDDTARTNDTAHANDAAIVDNTAAAIDATTSADPTIPEPRATAETEPETTDATTAKARKRTRRRRPTRASTARPARPVRRAIVTAVLAVALIATIAVAAVLTVQYRNAIRTDHARTAAVTEAERAAPVIFSYDYRHLDRDFSKAEAFLTGSFRDQYAKTTQTVVKPTALQYHGAVKAAVAKPSDGSAAAISVVSATPDQVVVLVFVDQSTTSTRVTGTQVDQNRVLLTLTHTPQGWRISAVAAL